MLTFFGQHEPDRFSDAIDELLRDERLRGENMDEGTVGLLGDIRQLALASGPRPAFVDALEEDLRRRAAQPADPLEAPATASRWHRLRVLSAGRLRLAAAALLLLIIGAGAAFWLSPEVRAQVARLSCFVPGLGIRACEGPGLIVASPAAVSRGGATLTVKSLLSAGGETVVSLEIQGLQGPLDQQLFRDVHVSLQDTAGKTIPPAPRPYSVSGPVNNRPGAPPAPLAINEATFAALNPSARAVDVLVSGPEPMGSWQVRVPLQPTARAGLTEATPGASSVTLQGIRASPSTWCPSPLCRTAP